MKPESAEYEERVRSDGAKSFNAHSKKTAYLQPEGSHKPNNRNRMCRSSSFLSHRHFKKNKWLTTLFRLYVAQHNSDTDTVGRHLSNRSQLKSSNIKRANTRTIVVRAASSRKRTFSFVACIKGWQTTVTRNRTQGLLRGIVGHNKGKGNFQRFQSAVCDKRGTGWFPPSFPAPHCTNISVTHNQTLTSGILKSSHSNTHS